MIATRSDWEAWTILYVVGLVNHDTPFNEAGNLFIMMAERIKAERLLAAMEK